MALETASYISQLVANNPTHSDGVNQGDAHLRLLKSVLQNQLPSLGAVVINITGAQLNLIAATTTAFLTALMAGTPIVAVGSAGAPSISFGTDQTTGLYASATGHVNIATGGVDTIDIAVAGLNIVNGNLFLAGTAVFPLQAANLGAGQVVTAALAASAVTYAKLQNASATTLIGNPTGSAAAPEEITLGGGLAFSGTTLVNTGPQKLLASISTDLLINNDGTSPTVQVDITASEAVLSNFAGSSVYFSGISTSINTGVSGVGGMGATSGTRAANQSYFWWLISNGSTIAGLGSKQSTYAGLVSSGDLPSGYTFAKRIGANFTDASSNLYRVKQAGTDAQYVVTAATNTAALPFITSTNNEGSITVPTWVQKPLAGIVPTTAARVTGVAVASGVSNGLIVAPNNSYGAFNSVTNSPPVQLWGSGGLTLAVGFEFVLETQNIYTANSFASGNARVQALGWEDTV